MTTPGGPNVVRRAAVYGFSMCLAISGVTLTSLVDTLHVPAQAPVTVPWWALMLAYLIVLQRPLDYETRRETRSLTLTQIPMVIGLVCVAPWWHLLAYGTAALVDPCLRRLPPMKVLYNVAMSLAEVGIAAGILALFTDSFSPRPLLWLALMTAILVNDIVTSTSIVLVLWLVGVPQDLRGLRSTVVGNLAVSGVFTSLGIVAVAAAWSDRWTLVIIVVLTLGLALGYRRHRRLSQESAQAVELQQFLKGLGPFDPRTEQNADGLEHVRVLLHAEELELAVRSGEQWSSFRCREGSPLLVSTLDAAPTLASTPIVGPDDHMSSPLLHNGELIGVLTARERMGSARTFALRDLRLVEAVANELAKAVDRGQMQRQLALAATTDPLTHLPNLNETSRRIDLLLTTEPLIVAAVAVDSFREVNDTLGHEVGDELLLEVTRRLELGYAAALIGRIGGGRFAVAVTAASVGGDASMFGLGIRAQVEGGAQLGPVGTHIRLSVGCVSAPEHGEDAATLIRRAETAMYGARHAHGGPVVWEPVYEVEGQRRLAVVMALREALSSGAIGVAFQPKLSANGRTVTGVEALARWTHPALGAISPSEFVPLAEAAGLMGPLTTSVLRQALTACKGWQRRAGRIGVAVNVSADTILDPAFVTEVAAVLTSINISPDLLTLELTEGVVVTDPQLAAQRMTEMRALGVKISVDDFGTGYSSLTYLKGLPVDEVKIDKGFVDDLAHEPGDRAVVRAVVDIAHTLGLRVVAEGVEHVEQGRLLQELGVDEVQGYLHARPMAALDMAQWLRRREDAQLSPDFTGY